jgi:hypothetical protein
VDVSLSPSPVIPFPPVPPVYPRRSAPPHAFLSNSSIASSPDGYAHEGSASGGGLEGISKRAGYIDAPHGGSESQSEPFELRTGPFPTCS